MAARKPPETEVEIAAEDLLTTCRAYRDRVSVENKNAVIAAMDILRDARARELGLLPPAASEVTQIAEAKRKAG